MLLSISWTWHYLLLCPCSSSARAPKEHLATFASWFHPSSLWSLNQRLCLLLDSENMFIWDFLSENCGVGISSELIVSTKMNPFFLLFFQYFCPKIVTPTGGQLLNTFLLKFMKIKWPLFSPFMSAIVCMWCVEPFVPLLFMCVRAKNGAPAHQMRGAEGKPMKA